MVATNDATTTLAACRSCLRKESLSATPCLDLCQRKQVLRGAGGKPFTPVVHIPVPAPVADRMALTRALARALGVGLYLCSIGFTAANDGRHVHRRGNLLAGLSALGEGTRGRLPFAAVHPRARAGGRLRSPVSPARLDADGAVTERQSLQISWSGVTVRQTTSNAVRSLARAASVQSRGRSLAVLPHASRSPRGARSSSSSSSSSSSKKHPSLPPDRRPAPRAEPCRLPSACTLCVRTRAHARAKTPTSPSSSVHLPPSRPGRPENDLGVCVALAALARGCCTCVDRRAGRHRGRLARGHVCQRGLEPRGGV